MKINIAAWKDTSDITGARKADSAIFVMSSPRKAALLGGNIKHRDEKRRRDEDSKNITKLDATRAAGI